MTKRTLCELTIFGGRRDQGKRSVGFDDRLLLLVGVSLYRVGLTTGLLLNTFRREHRRATQLTPNHPRIRGNMSFIVNCFLFGVYYEVGFFTRRRLSFSGRFVSASFCTVVVV